MRRDMPRDMRVRISRMGGAQGPGAPGGAGESSSQSDADAWRELLRGGEDVAQVMSDMANILDEISGLEGREEELAVQMAAAAAIAGRVSTLDQSFLVALEFMMGQADANNDSKGRWLLEVVKEQLLSQLQQKMPPQVQVVSLLVATSDKNRRQDIITRALAGGGKLPAEASPGGNMGGMGGMEPPEVQVPGARLEEIVAQADDLVASMEEQLPIQDPFVSSIPSLPLQSPPPHLYTPQSMEEQLPIQDPFVSSIPSLPLQSPPPHLYTPQSMEEQLPIQDPFISSIPSLPLQSPPPHLYTPQSMEEQLPIQDPFVSSIPSLPLQSPPPHLYTPQSMEEQLPIQDRRLLARLLLAREEARTLMAGGVQDPRNDVRRLKNVPEAEVRGGGGGMVWGGGTGSRYGEEVRGAGMGRRYGEQVWGGGTGRRYGEEVRGGVQEGGAGRRWAAEALLPSTPQQQLGSADFLPCVRAFCMGSTQVRFISTLVAMRSPDALKNRIFDVMEGRQEGEYKKGSDGPIKVGCALC
ncbi:unnamed protein product [Closterium sp. Naga37s-1]|nr:unnamed protein product [Closterium sp. Naga37s-1]